MCIKLLDRAVFFILTAILKFLFGFQHPFGNKELMYVEAID